MEQFTPIITVAALVALVAGGVGAYAAYKQGGRKALQDFLTKLFVVVDTIWRAVEWCNRQPNMSNEAKQRYVLEEAVATANVQGVGGLLSRDLLLKIIEGTVTLAKRNNSPAATVHSQHDEIGSYTFRRAGGNGG